jgi:alanine racemase
MNYTARALSRVMEGELCSNSTQEIGEIIYRHVSTDSRKLVAPSEAVFFALLGSNRDGAQFIPSLIQAGVSCFVLAQKSFDKIALSPFLDRVNFILVEDPLLALQKLAQHHRKQFSKPVIAVTGSNGKTIVKEWLYQLMENQLRIVRSPRSYNSALGVPLSLLQLEESQHDLAIIEAGISQAGEMKTLQKMISPDIGILTHMGPAHEEGFSSFQEKLKEKMTLFSGVKVLFLCNSTPYWKETWEELKKTSSSAYQAQVITWGTEPENQLQLFSRVLQQRQYQLQLMWHPANSALYFFPSLFKPQQEGSAHSTPNVHFNNSNSNVVLHKAEPQYTVRLKLDWTQIGEPASENLLLSLLAWLTLSPAFLFEESTNREGIVFSRIPSMAALDGGKNEGHFPQPLEHSHPEALEQTIQRFIQQHIQQLSSLAMRLELKRGIQGCVLINDSYNADPDAFSQAMEFLKQQQFVKNTVIISDLPSGGSKRRERYEQLANLLKNYPVGRFIAVGLEVQEFADLFQWIPQRDFLKDTGAFKAWFRPSYFSEEAILVKGSRSFKLEEVISLLEEQVHQTVLEVNLSELGFNLAAYRRVLNPGVKVMVMVKAFSYGTGGVEIARTLQFLGVDYLTVAYADEGVLLRKAGIQLPIMVMNPEPATFDAIFAHDLQPDIYSFGLLEQWQRYLQKQGAVQYPIHLELETGMNRLGFAEQEWGKLEKWIAQQPNCRVVSVFSHLAASEDPSFDAFTLSQAAKFEQAISAFRRSWEKPFWAHLSNTAGISRHPSLQYDMVRLGIGLYGISPESSSFEKIKLHPVATLRTTIAQLKVLEQGETVGYGRKGVIYRKSLIATVRIGYADGYPRTLGHGVGWMWVLGHRAPTIGSVCMDMTMIDVTEIPGVQEGTEVEVFGGNIDIKEVANWAKTIPYEILTNISQRVQRVYVEH